MAVLGLLLLLSAIGLSLDVVFENTSSLSVDAVGQTFTLSFGWVFVAGVITGAVALLGVSMLFAGMAKARRRRVALAESRGTSQDLQTDRDRLAAELDAERAGRTSTTPTPPRGAAAVPEHGAAAVDREGEGRQAVSAPGEDAGLADADGREPVAAGRHGLLHRRDH